MPFLLLILLLARPEEALAEFYACPSPDGDHYTESPSGSHCRLLEIQPPALVYERQPTGAVTARGSGPWPRGSAEAQAELCGLYREWRHLSRKRYANVYDLLPDGLTPHKLNRLYNLDLLFSHRGQPDCAKH